MGKRPPPRGVSSKWAKSLHVRRGQTSLVGYGSRKEQLVVEKSCSHFHFEKPNPTPRQKKNRFAIRGLYHVISQTIFAYPHSADSGAGRRPSLVASMKEIALHPATQDSNQARPSIGNRLIYFQTNPINTKHWYKKVRSKVRYSSVFILWLYVWVCVCVCMSGSEAIKKRRLTWCGHLLRLPEDTPARLALKEFLRKTKRPPGKPKTTWMSQLKTELTSLQIDPYDLDYVTDLASDRNAWRAMVRCAMSSDGKRCWWWNWEWRNQKAPVLILFRRHQIENDENKNERWRS